MRMSDTLRGFRGKPEDYKDNSYLSRYVPAIEEISAVTHVPFSRWTVWEDSQERSTLAGGKSSCAFLVANFGTLKQAFSAAAALQEEMPSVNLEIFVAPDGRQDQGDGIGSYDYSSRDAQKSGYIQNEGFGVSVLVDAQNVARHLKANPSTSGQSFIRRQLNKLGL